MNTLTQVWVFSLALCSALLICFFKFGGRLGLFAGFLFCLILLYLLLHKGIQLLQSQIKAELHKGSDPTGFNSLLAQNKIKYSIHKYSLYYTQNKTHPLVWQDFQNEVHIILNRTMVEKLNSSEKQILAHFMLSHGAYHSKIRRRFLSILYLALSPISLFLTPLFNLASKWLQLHQQILKADLAALTISGSKTQSQFNDFSLLLRKIHNLNFHNLKYKRGENYFSILSTASSGILNLKLSPSLESRLKNMSGSTGAS